MSQPMPTISAAAMLPLSGLSGGLGEHDGQCAAAGVAALKLP